MPEVEAVELLFQALQVQVDQELVVMVDQQHLTLQDLMAQQTPGVEAAVLMQTLAMLQLQEQVALG